MLIEMQMMLVYLSINHRHSKLNNHRRWDNISTRLVKEKFNHQTMLVVINQLKIKCQLQKAIKMSNQQRINLKIPNLLRTCWQESTVKELCQKKNGSVPNGEPLQTPPMVNHKMFPQIVHQQDPHRIQILQQL